MGALGPKHKLPGVLVKPPDAKSLEIFPNDMSKVCRQVLPQKILVFKLTSPFACEFN